MSAPARRLATRADLLDLPEDVVGEIISGALVETSRPRGPHTHVHSALLSDVATAFQRGRGGPGGWWIYTEPELWFENGDTVVPDIAGWRRERLPALPEETGFTVPPDWVCEVVSPTRPSYDRITKLSLYARERIPWFWLVDARRRIVEGLRCDDGVYSLVGEFGPGVEDGAAEARIPPFDAVALDLGQVFPVGPPG